MIEVTFELGAPDDDGAAIAYVITVASYREHTDMVDIALEPFATVLRDGREVGVVPLRVAYLALAADRASCGVRGYGRRWTMDLVAADVEDKCITQAAKDAADDYEDQRAAYRSDRAEGWY